MSGKKPLQEHTISHSFGATIIVNLDLDASQIRGTPPTFLSPRDAMTAGNTQSVWVCIFA